MSNNGPKKIEIPSAISVRDLATQLSVSPIDIIKKLMSNGVMASINQAIDYDTAAIVAAEFGFEAVPIAQAEPAAGGDRRGAALAPHDRRGEGR